VPLLGVLVVSTAAACAVDIRRHEAIRVLLVAIAIAAYAGAITTHRRRPWLTIRAVAPAAAILLDDAVAQAPRASRDQNANASNSRLVARYHQSPYRVTPAAHPADPIVRAMAPGWRTAKSVYGPVFTAVSAAAMALTGGSVLGARLFFQTLAALAVAACLLLLWRRTRDPAAVAYLGLHPVVALAVVNGGHNDVLVGLAILAAIVVVSDGGEASDGRVVAAGLLLAAATLVKIIGILPLGALCAYLWVRRGWRTAARVAIPSTVVMVAAYLAVGGLTALKPISEGASRESRASIWLGVLRLLSLGQPHLRAAPSTLQLIQVLAALAIGALALVTVLGRLRDRDPALAAATAVVAYLLAAAYVLPWYAAWALPVLALAWRSRLSLLAAGHAALLVLAYEDTPTLVHPGIVHTVMRGLWGYGLPAAEVAAVVALLAIGGRRFLANRTSPPAGVEGSVTR
jgi:hypothetical protein